jgi:hypothetical protein
VTGDSVTLSRDGKVLVGRDLGGGPQFSVPVDNGTYKLAVNAERGPAFALSTKVSTVWTFRSGHVDPAGWANLPMWTVLFHPGLDATNTAPANQTITVPVNFVAQPDSAVGKLVDRTVDASFDNGKTWAPLKLDNNAVSVRNPAGSGFVSLRATAKDSKGSAVSTTIIHAYRYGPAH